MAGFSDILAGAQFRADLQDTNRVSQAEWVTLVNEALRSAWTLAASARPDFQVTSQDFVVASGTSASFVVPLNFFAEIDVVFGPDTGSEYSLGPFAWQNRRAPGGWLPPFTSSTGAGGTRARLQGMSIYIEPSLRAGGTYRLWYCPRPKTCEFTVRLATTAQLPPCTVGGAGVGATLTAIGNGALSVDGTAVAAADRILVKGNVSSNGIYTITQPGSAGTPFVLTRATDYDQSSDGVYVGNVVTSTAGVVNTNAFHELVSFGATGFGIIDTDIMVWGVATIDAVLNPFDELLKVKAAIPAVMRDEGDASTWAARQTQLEGELGVYFRQVRTSNGPQKMVDTDQMGPRAFWGGGW